MSLDAACAQSWGWGDTGPRYRRYYDDRCLEGFPLGDDRRQRTRGWWNLPWEDPYESARL